MNLPSPSDVLCDALARGVSVERAYAFVADYVALLEARGEPGALRIPPRLESNLPDAEELFAEHYTRKDSRLLHLIVSGDLADIPSAKCIADHLPKDRPPTRADVESAIAACRRRSP